MSTPPLPPDEAERLHALRAEDRRRLFELSHDPMCVAGFDGSFLELNPPWELLLDQLLPELRARGWLDLVHPEDRAHTVAETARLRTRDQAVVFESRCRAADGRYRWLRWNAAATPEHDAFYAVVRDVTARRAAEEAPPPIAFHDALTELPNRALLVDRLERLLGRARRVGVPVAVLHLDLDAFRRVNDRVGRLAADQILVGVARRLEHTVRPGDLVARLEGDDFAIVLEHVRDPAVVGMVADRILEEVTGPYTVSGREMRLGVNMGLVVSAPAHQRAQDLLRDAHAALESARQSGQGGWRKFEP